MQIEIPEIIQIKELASKLNKPAGEIIGKLMNFGILVNLNQDIDYDTAAILADEFGFEVTPLTSPNFPSLAAGGEGRIGEIKENLATRPPVVSIMGHVDHGKTTLLDYIRQSKITDTEAGGITQKISAYQVEIGSRKVTFLDTPGHSAFEATRKHGASITDLVILVVAADEGVKPQTVEVINHANLARVPIIVAINKIDKPEADIEKIKRQFADLNLIPEEWGGQTVFVPIAAKSGQGVDKLLEMIFLITDLKELKAEIDSPGFGVVIESHVAPGIGSQATILIQNGSLKLNDYIVAGEIFGKVRTLVDGKMKKSPKIGPGDPGVISGLSGLPEFASPLNVVSSEKEAKIMAKQNQRMKSVKTIKLQDFNLTAQSTEKREGKTLYKIILKADTKGSIDAIKKSIKELENDDVGINIVAADIGEISESDIKLAESTKATVIGFSVRLNSEIKKLAQNLHISAETYSIIYDLLDSIELVLSQLMPVIKIEIEQAELEVLAIFKPNKKNEVIGGIVKSGELTKGLFQLKRGAKILAQGEIKAIKRGKDEVKSVKSGTECGLELDIQEIISEDFDKEIKIKDSVIKYMIQEQQKPYHK